MTFAAKTIPPVLLKLKLPLVVIPTVFTVPTVYPEFSTKVIEPVLPAKVVMALEVLVKVYVPFVPNSSRPAAAIKLD